MAGSTVRPSFATVVCGAALDGIGDPDRLVVRVSAPMSDLHRLAGLDGGAGAIAFVPAGVIVIGASPAHAESVLARIDAACEGSRAHRHVVSAPIGLKRSIDVWHGRRQPEGLTRAIKSAFDPTGVLSPGRMPGLL